MMDIKRVIFQQLLNCLSVIKNDISDQPLADKLQKKITRNFNKRRVHSNFIGNIWGSDLADM